MKKEFELLADPKKAILLSRFFKTGRGEYGEGDVFLGIMVPEQKMLAKKYIGLPLDDLFGLLKSKIHEHRLTALFILVLKFKEADDLLREKIYNIYLSNTGHINNWDLVDCSAPKIVGGFLLDRKRDILYKMVKSESLWERRIAVLSTFMFISKNDFTDSLRLSAILLKDKHDLIHKAVGWMLREIGKRDQDIEEGFLKRHYRTMPRTMLRYAIERFDQKKKSFYMSK